MKDDIRAILIDPHQRTIREIEANFRARGVLNRFVAQGKIGDLYAPLCSGPRLGRDVITYVDDEGCFRDGQAWCQITGVNAPLAGYVVVAGEDGGEIGNLGDGITIALLDQVVHWIEPAMAQAIFPPTRVMAIGSDGLEVSKEFPIDFSERRPMPSRPL